MMYISVFPIAISMRRTNVYEEKSLGIYSAHEDEEDEAREPSYIGAHLRKQLSFDLWYIFLGLFIIAIVEGDRLEDPNQNSFTLFTVLFEIVSAYGTVGLSLGYPNVNASFCSQFRVISKLVIISMQIRGRHRGLPSLFSRKSSLMPNVGCDAGAPMSATCLRSAASNHRAVSGLRLVSRLAELERIVRWRLIEVFI
jgi:Trk-type K+ transport system membrane component